MPDTIASHGDCYRVTKLGQMPSFDKSVMPWRWVWKTAPSGWRIVGKLDVQQEACPNVDTTFAAFDLGQRVQLFYHSFSRYDVDVTIQVGPALTGLADWIELTYEQDQLVRFTVLWLPPTIPTDWLSQPTFQVNTEGASLLKSLALDASSFSADASAPAPSPSSSSAAVSDKN
jgi:hypothetical protein